MSRELDFIDFINEQAEKEGRSEPTKPLTNRELLANALESIEEYPSEEDILIKYKDTLLQLNQKVQELHDTQELWDNISAGSDKNYLTIKNQLQDEAFNIASQRDDLDRQLIELEQNPILQKIIERERLKDLGEKASQRMKELKVKYEEHKAEKELEQMELMNRYRETRQAAIQKRREAESQLKQESTPTASKEEPKIERKTDTIKSFLSSIPFSFLGLLEFYIIYGLTILGIALVFLLLSYIPIISTLVDWLFRIREDTPDMFAMCFATMLAYLGTMATAAHINKGIQKHALMLTGIYLVVLNIIFLIVNLINNDAIFANVTIGIAGIVMFYKSKNEL